MATFHSIKIEQITIIESIKTVEIALTHLTYFIIIKAIVIYNKLKYFLFKINL